MLWLCLCKQANITFLCECFITCLRKSAPEIGVKCLVFFTFFISFFYENINQEHNLLPDCAFGPFPCVCCKNCMSGYSAFVLSLSKSDNISFRKMPNGICLFCSASWSLVGEITQWVHELRVMAAVELHLNAKYYAQHLAPKSVYGKDQSVIASKLFSSYRRIRQCA